MRKLLTLTAVVLTATVGTTATQAEHGFKQGKPKTWDQYTMYQQHNIIHRNRVKALSVIDFFLKNPKLRHTPTGKKKFRAWTVRLRKIGHGMEVVHDRIYLANSCWPGPSCAGSWTIRKQMVTEEVCRYDWQGTPCSGSYSAVNVSYCESAGTFLADPGDDPGNPYMGLFELGPTERAYYGRGIYASTSYDVAKKAGVVDMVWSAHHLFVGEGRGWGPWVCKPDGHPA